MGLGQLKLKGGEVVSGSVSKKKKSKKSKKAQANESAEQQPGPGTSEALAEGDPAHAPSSAQAPAGMVPAFEYEKEFKFESERMDAGKARSTAWGVSYRAPPAILHGYDAKVRGDTYEEKLDLRCAKKADRMCK
jgi:FAM32A